MSYVPPELDAVDFSFVGEPAYTSPAVDAVTFNFPIPIPAATGVAVVSTIIGDTVARGTYILAGVAQLESIIKAAAYSPNDTPLAARGYVSVTSLVRAQGSATRVVSGSATASIVRGTGLSVPQDSSWVGLGLPLPTIASYNYTHDRGLVRTKMDSGATRQRRKWTNGYRKASLTFNVPLEDLRSLEGFVAAYGYDWFNIPLVTENNYNSAAEDHDVRVIADPTVGSVYGDNIDVTLQVEIK